MTSYRMLQIKTITSLIIKVMFELIFIIKIIIVKLQPT